MRTHRIDVRAHSSVPLAAVYALVADGSSWPVWGRWESYEIEKAGEDGKDGVGAIRKFRRGRMVTRELVVELSPRRFSYDLLSGLAIRDYRAHLDLEPDGTGTSLHWHSSFRAGVPGTGRLYRAQMQKFIQDAAQRLAAHAERKSAQHTP
jgi:hypothetical protein